MLGVSTNLLRSSYIHVELSLPVTGEYMGRCKRLLIAVLPTTGGALFDGNSGSAFNVAGAFAFFGDAEVVRATLFVLFRQLVSTLPGGGLSDFFFLAVSSLESAGWSPCLWEGD